MTQGSDPHDQIKPLARAHEGRETILVVDDDRAVRALARAILSRAGYTVVEAPDAEAAIEVAEQHAGSIQLLLTDIKMPGKGGHALEEQLSQTLPKLKTLFMSGDPSNSLIRRGPTVVMAPFVPKPFTPEMLVRAVRAVLDTP